MNLDIAHTIIRLAHHLDGSLPMGDAQAVETLAYLVGYAEGAIGIRTSIDWNALEDKVTT